MASYLSTTAHYCDIRIPVAAHHGPSEALKLVARWVPHVTVAISLPPEIQLIEKDTWHVCAGMWAMSVLIG